MADKNSGGRGFWGKILHVDLTDGRVEYENVDEAVYQKYLGGVGLGAKVLWDRMKPGADPLGPDNILGFTTGILVDTGTLFTGRFMVVGKSPVYNGWGDSNCGGYFAPALKRCGIDAVFVRGAADRPVTLFVSNEQVEIRDAGDLWGADAIETENRLKQTYGKTAQVACIGPAGEKKCLFAGISNDGGRYAGRAGLGAVMGSKNLKAVVAAGKTRPTVADKERIKALTKKFNDVLEGGQGMQKILGDRLLGAVGWITRKGSVYTRQPADLFRQILKKYGTSGLTALSAESGDSPIKNWGGVGYTDFPLSKSQKIGAQAVRNYEVKKYGCYSCPVRCGGIMKIENGPHPVAEMHKPEYETLCAFGSLCLTTDLQAIFKLNDLCNRGGVDTISCGAVTAFAIECFENGVLTEKDTGGLALRWGDGEAAIRLVRMIIDREGLGDLLAEGVVRAAAKIGRGAERFAVHCGGLEPPMHDPKFDPGFAPVYHVDPTPGRHTTASYTYLDLQVMEKHFKRAKKIPAAMTHKKRHTYAGAAEAVAINVMFKQLVDGAGACLFGVSVGGPLPLCEWLNAATGWNWSKDEYLAAGERIEQLRHAFNVREGINPLKDWRPHPRVYGNPAQDHGPAKGITVDLDTMSREFYQAFKWDPADGRPDKAHLEKLGLDELARALHP